jgi:hypothetical protein
MSPQEDRIGRCCKIGKETIFGLLKALEMFVDQDFDATLRMYDERARVISDAVKKFGVTALPRQFNPEALGNVTPRYGWQIDPSKLNITGPEVMQKLADTRPVGIGSLGAGASGLRGHNPDAPAENPNVHHGPQRDPHTFGFPVWQLKDGEDKLIADRLVEIFSAAPKSSRPDVTERRLSRSFSDAASRSTDRFPACRRYRRTFRRYRARGT